MNKNTTTLIFIVCLILFYAIQTRLHSTAAYTSTQTQIHPQVITLGTQTKTSGCQISGSLPDSACTPGAAIADVTEAQVCTSGYSKSVRKVSELEKRMVYLEYGITNHVSGQYEVDHYISLEIGGSNDISNLWPEAATPTPGFHEKDVVEDWLHAQVCSGRLSLSQAQQEEVGNWVDLYNALPR